MTGDGEEPQEMTPQDRAEYQALFDNAMRDTLTIGALPKNLEGKEGNTLTVARDHCTASAVFLDGEWEGVQVRGLLTAGHVAKEIAGVEGRGIAALGRTRDGRPDGKTVAFVEAEHIDERMEGNLLVPGHRDVRLNDIGLIWLSRDGAERLRSSLGCTGYNPGRGRRPYEGTPSKWKALCAAANNEWRRKRTALETPVEAAFAVDGLVRGTLEAHDVKTGERVERQIWHAQIEQGNDDMRGASGSGVWRQCHEEDGGRELVGITGSYLQGWPEKGRDALLIVPLDDALNQLVALPASHGARGQ